jgi:hypothetical protein
MTETLDPRDRKLVESFKPHYEESGFDFNVEPSRDELPDFLQDFRPAAIARPKAGGDGGIVVAVKRYKQPAESTRLVTRLASEVAKHPKWRLDLVFSTPFHPLGGWLLPSEKEIRSELSAFRAQLADFEAGRESVGDARVLLLLLWPLFEATARRRLSDENIDLGKKPLNSKAVLDLLVTEDVISDEDGQLATDLLQHKEYVSAGFREPTVDIEQIKRLAGLTDRLLSTRKSAAA